MSESLLTIPKNLNPKVPQFARNIQDVYVVASKILGMNFFYHYTDHSIEHSKRIINYIDILIGKCPLSDEEKFILVCAVLLHDIGMQAPSYITDEIFPLEKGFSEIFEEVREKHHEISYKLIIDSVKLDNQNRTDLGINKENEIFIDAIATVAKNHRKLNIKEIKERPIGNVKIRLKLLCALMCFGDCLDITRDRVIIDALNRINIRNEHVFFWYIHEYITGLLLENNMITIAFTFPKKYQIEEKLVNHIRINVEDEIKKHYNIVHDTFLNNQILLNNEIEFDIDYSDAKKDMPEILKKYINMLISRKEKDELQIELFKLGLTKEMEDPNVEIDKFLYDRLSYKEGHYIERETHLKELIRGLQGNKNKVSRIILFGGIPTIIRKSAKELSKWLIDNEKSKLFICYESNDLINNRKDDLKEDAYDNHTNKEEELLKRKTTDLEVFRNYFEDELGPNLRQRICFIQLLEHLSGYVTVNGTEIFFTPLLHKRSSETFTFTFKFEQKEALDVVDYMISKLPNDSSELIRELELIRTELKNKYNFL
ncbi:hypothetical protein AGMMS50268_32210 [Spirochaetia bacterium]|nr:hypothetical protein AGMMS50268_32210 [Spirochaetia bacterium]